MIFKRQFKPFTVASKKIQLTTWKQKFKFSLYKHNFKNAINPLNNNDINEEINDKVGENLIKNLRKNFKKCQQKQNKDSAQVNHPFCIYIPLKKSVQLDDEIVNTFVYLRKLKQQNNMIQIDNFYTQIRKFLRFCKKDNKIQEGWRVCLKRFLIGLDVIKKMDIYLQILKYGYKQFQVFHNLFAKPTLIDIFIERIMAMSKYFQSQAGLNKTWKISVQLNDKINQANISKTMKMLYCSICLIYDCGKHKLEDLSHQKDHHYSSPKNYIQKSTHIIKAIQILKQVRNLQVNFSSTNQFNYCSQHCFKKLDKKNYTQKEILKSKLISPMTESLIKIGIQLFSYSPCRISKLFPNTVPIHSRITCCIVFLYLIQQGNLQSRLDFKTCSNEVQFLMREEGSNDTNLWSIQNKHRNLLPKKRKTKITRTQQYRYHKVATCFHSYIGQEPFDQGCLECVCRLRGFCLPQCQCNPNCPLMIPGCSCKCKQDCQNLKCFCYRTKTQCIPGICLGCFPTNGHPKRNACKNDQILRGMNKSIKIGFSKISGAGFGAFANQKIKKGSLILTYCGEVLDQQMQGLRETLKKDDSFYNFACSEGSIDARFMGNKTRFINHGNQNERKTNLVSLNMFSCGQQFIGLYAIRDIQQGEQLLFDYDVEGQVAKIHSEHYIFLKKDLKVQVHQQ